MKKLLALLFCFVILVSACSVTAFALEKDTVQNKIISLVASSHADHGIVKDDVHITYLEPLTEGKYLVNYIVDGMAYTCDEVEMTLGNYHLHFPSRPVPEIYANDKLYALERAYQQGVIDDSDLDIMDSISYINMYYRKTSDELLINMQKTDRNDYINVRFMVEGSEKTWFDMPSWDIKITEAIKELNAYYETLHEKLVNETLKDFDIIDQAHNNGVSVISVKCGDINKISEIDFITDMDYISDIHLKYIETFSPHFDEYTYNELADKSSVNGNLQYTLINAHNNMGASAIVGFRFNNTIVCSESIYSNFTYQYGVYDHKEDKFYDLFELRKTPDKYEGLEELLQYYKIGRPIGDTDCNYKVTVLDATAIQRHLANLDYLFYDYYVSHEVDEVCQVSDMDFDNEITVMDATIIQRQVASLE